MKVPSLRRGCEIAPFFVRYMDEHRSIRARCANTYSAMRYLQSRYRTSTDESVSVGDVRYRSCDFYAPQTKILEGGTKDEIRIFD